MAQICVTSFSLKNLSMEALRKGEVPRHIIHVRLGYPMKPEGWWLSLYHRSSERLLPSKEGPSHKTTREDFLYLQWIWSMPNQ